MEQLKELPTTVKVSYIGITFGMVILPLMLAAVFFLNAELVPLFGMMFMSWWMWWKTEISYFLLMDYIHLYFDYRTITETREVPHVLVFLLKFRSKIEKSPIDYFTVFGILTFVVLGLFFVDMAGSTLIVFVLICCLLVAAYPANTFMNRELQEKIKRQQEEFEKQQMEGMRKIILDRIKELEDNDDSDEEKK